MNLRNRGVTPKATKTTSRTAPEGKKLPKAIKIEPLPPDSGLDVWITPRQASGIMGVGRGAIYRLIEREDALLVTRRPLPRKVLVSLLSVKAFIEATKDPLFWTSTELQQAHLNKLKKIPNS